MGLIFQSRRDDVTRWVVRSDIGILTWLRYFRLVSEILDLISGSRRGNTYPAAFSTMYKRARRSLGQNVLFDLVTITVSRSNVSQTMSKRSVVVFCSTLLPRVRSSSYLY